MNRRKLLRALALTTAGLAGCQGDGGGENGGGTTTAATTTGEFYEVDVEAPSIESYDSHLSSLGDADSYLFESVPSFSDTIERMNTGSRSLTGLLTAVEDQRPTVSVDPTNVEEYFLGYHSGMKFITLDGSFSVDSLGDDIAEDRNFEATGESVRDLELHEKSGELVGLSSDRFVWVKGGFSDPREGFETVLSTAAGETEPFTASHEPYRLLTENLRSGHWVESAPNEAERWGAQAYGRQRVIGSENSIYEEVAVFSEGMSDEAFRSTVEAESDLVQSDEIDASIDTVESAADGRVMIARLDPVPNRYI